MSIKKIIYYLIILCFSLIVFSCTTLNNHYPKEKINKTNEVKDVSVTVTEIPPINESNSQKIIISESISKSIKPTTSSQIEAKSSNLIQEELPSNLKLSYKDTQAEYITKEDLNLSSLDKNPFTVVSKKIDTSQTNIITPEIPLKENTKSYLAPIPIDESKTTMNKETKPIVKDSLVIDNLKTRTDNNKERKYMDYLTYITIIFAVLFFSTYKYLTIRKQLIQERDKNKRLNINTIEESNAKIYSLNIEYQKLLELFDKKKFEKAELLSTINKHEIINSKLETTINNKNKKLNRVNEIYKSIDYSLNTYNKSFGSNLEFIKNINPEDLNDANLFAPSVIINLQHMNYKELRKEFNKYNKLVDELLERYRIRYTTKTNKTIYSLMTLALQSELQNILYNLKFEKLDKAIDQVKVITSKYLVIASEGNKSIENTLVKFIGELEYLFICLVKVEYEYYIKKEQAKQEQAAIRMQMKEEAEDKRRLEQEAKKIQDEKSKYLSEIEKLEEQQRSETDQNKLSDISDRLSELNNSINSMKDKEEEILKLQNGKAGNVYVISNLGSFGDNTFKIGMTRRINPIERINELGSASVPFKFDVHSFIFSDDAVTLENELHKRLNNNRVNKINKRKEFFNVEIDELEEIVLNINPTAEFNKTMIAEEYRQTLSQKTS